MKIIAAITRNNGLGRDGDMLHHISPDLKRFKALTMGHPVIMGRRTFESFPKGPLPGRRNLVITRNADYTHPGIETYPSIDAAIDACPDVEPYILGGGQIYAQAMPLADELNITEIDDEGENADTFFPDIDPKLWIKTNIGQWETDPRSGVRFRFVDYKKNS